MWVAMSAYNKLECLNGGEEKRVVKGRKGLALYIYTSEEIKLGRDEAEAMSYDGVDIDFRPFFSCS